MYQNTSLTAYSNDLAAKLPAPGGGSAAALTAALGASLISMVLNFTVGKPKFAEFEKELRAMLDTSEKLRREFLSLVDLDVTAFTSGDPRKALDVPLIVARLSCEAARLCPPLLTKANPNVITDVGCAAAMLDAAFACAVFNIDINLKAINDKKLHAMVHKQLRQQAKEISRIRIRTEEYLGAHTRG
jgi:glutamate formiminotransferase/formiminotetrahydrofolate cyclodeaminase